MKATLRTALVSVVAVLAISAIGAASASAALPEFSTAGVFPATFTYKGGAVTLMEEGGAHPGTVHCTASTGEGSITSAKALTTKFTFTGCKVEGFPYKCTNGTGEEEIKTEELSGSLVYTAKATKAVGIVLNHPTFAAFNCGGNLLISDGLNGGAIALPTPVNTSSSTLTLKLARSGWVNTPSEYENEKSEKVRRVLEVNLTGNYPNFLREGSLETEGKLEKFKVAGKEVAITVKA